MDLLLFPLVPCESGDPALVTNWVPASAGTNGETARFTLNVSTHNIRL
jgi:hypothetical protein